MRPIHEPAKPTKHMRHMMTRMRHDERFADLVEELRRIATEALAPPSLVVSAAAIVAHEIRQHDYVARQCMIDEGEFEDDCED